MRRNKLKTRIACALLSIMVAICFAPSMAFADGTDDDEYVDAKFKKTVDSITYAVYDDANYAVVYDYESGYPGTMTILSSIKMDDGNTYPVTEIDVWAFDGAKGLTKVNIPDSVTVIGREAFTNTGIKEIKIPVSVKEIREYALGYTATYTYDEETGDEDAVYEKVPGFTIDANANSVAAKYARDNGFNLVDREKEAADRAAAEAKAKAAAKAKALKAASNINKAAVSASDIKKASKLGATTVTLGAKVKKIKNNAFKGTKIKTVVVKSKKLKKASVKGSLKGSKVTKIKVNVGSKKVSSKYVKKYKKIFTKKNAGKKVKVTR